MGCRLSDFRVVGEWMQTTVKGHKVTVADAVYADYPEPDPGVIYTFDGVFQGYTGTRTAVLYWVERKLEGFKPQPPLTVEMVKASNERLEREYRIPGDGPKLEPSRRRD
jgi:hypothetical protein